MHQDTHAENVRMVMEAWRKDGHKQFIRECERLGLSAQYHEADNYLDYFVITTPGGGVFSTSALGGNLYHIPSFLLGYEAALKAKQ